MAERLGTNAAKRQCSICKAPFMANQPRAQLAHHVESKVRARGRGQRGVGCCRRLARRRRPHGLGDSCPLTRAAYPLPSRPLPRPQHPKDTFEKCFPDFPPE